MCCRARVHGCVQTAGTKPRLRQTVSTPGGQRPSCLAGACGARRLLWSDKIAKQGIKHRLAWLDRRTSQQFVDSSTVAPSCPVSPRPLCVSCVVLETRLHCLLPCLRPSSAPTQPKQPERLEPALRAPLYVALPSQRASQAAPEDESAPARLRSFLDRNRHDLLRPVTPARPHIQSRRTLHVQPSRHTPAPKPGQNILPSWAVPVLANTCETAFPCSRRDCSPVPETTLHSTTRL